MKLEDLSIQWKLAYIGGDERRRLDTESFVARHFAARTYQRFMRWQTSWVKAREAQQERGGDTD